MDATHLTGWLLVTGSLAFGAGAGNPYLVRAWTAPQETFLAIVARQPLAWRLSHYLFIGGTVLTAAGLAGLPGVVPEGWPRGLTLAGTVGFAIAAALWLVSLLYRLAVAPTTARGFAESGHIEPWIADLDRLSGALFAAFIVIAFAALAAIGIATTAGGPIPAILCWGTAA
ncbi:MAG TPA: hypothetical protein VEY67_00650, partial [Candidatus Dormibacteraeota bacterium]|nr:hypothetical protein [Candidatus Dormibacteraeota bacterium]